MKNSKPKVLLASVFKPYAVDNAYSRRLNPMELFHNQITREQGMFSVRMFHQSWGLHMIAANISARTTVLDFPTLKRFEREVKKGKYDYVGISFIMANFKKAKKMTEIVREHSPQSKIILGGHGTQIENIKDMTEADYIVKGEGLRWFRTLLGDPVDAPLRHPLNVSDFDPKILGLKYPSATVVVTPGVGCWNACNFCSTTHLFGKKHLHFFESGRELYKIMDDFEKRTGKKSFFIMDENFLKHKPRFMELAQEIERNQKDWDLDIFASAEILKQFDLDWLIRIGVSAVWIGVESKFYIYPKNKNIDFKKLLDDLNQRGLITMVSAILFMDEHTQQNIDEDIDYTLSLKPDLTQFMIYTPLPGTALEEEKKAKGEMLNVAFEDRHGQYQLCHKHPHFTQYESEKILVKAFQKDFHELGPSVYRIFNKWLLRYWYARDRAKNDPLMKRRAHRKRRNLFIVPPALFIMRFFVRDRHIRQGIMELWKKVNKTLGIFAVLYYSPLYLIFLITLTIEYVRIEVLKRSREPKTILTRYNNNA